MECFGDIRKVSTVCSDSSFRSYTSRFATTRIKSELIVTESANLVTKYDIKESLKTVQSWSFEELNKLHIPLTVSYSPDSKQERFIGLHSGNRLIEWNLNEQNELKPVYERNFRVNIATILTFPVTTKFDCLVVLSNGGVEFFEKIKSDYFNENMTSIIDKNETIVHIESHIINQNDISLYLVASNKNGRISVYKSIVSKNSTETIRRTEKLILTEVIDAWTFSHSIGQLVGVCKVENKINVYSIEPSVIDSKQKNLLYSFDSSSIDSICSVATCSNGAVCLLGKRNSNSAFVLEIYEINYATKIGELTLTDPILPDDFCVLRDNVLITSKTNIIIVPILKQKILLSQLLTKNLYTDGSTSNNNDIKLKNSADFKIYLGITSNIDELSLKKIQIINRKFSNLHSENCNGIPEEIATDLFRFCTESYLSIQNGNTLDADQILSELKHFFRELVVLPINEIFLVSCLKSTNIKLDQYLLAIELLLELIPCKECFVIVWLSALLDANFRKFIIKPSQKEIDALNRIYDHISQSIRFYEDLEPIKTLLDSLINREKSVLSAISNEPTTTGQYSIELLSFS